MRRAVARGRVFPQSYSTDRRIGRLSLKACTLFPYMWVNTDDQGRLSGEPDEVKYTACPNIDHITKEDIPELLKELEKQKLIKVYQTAKSMVIQMLDWWDVERLQWAWPSDYPPPNGWRDRLRYKKSAKEVVTLNWVSPETSPERPPDQPPERSPETSPSGFLEPSFEKDKGKRRGRGRGRGNSPESSGEKPSPPLVGSPLLEKFQEVFPEAFGKHPDSREAAQLRDLSYEISSAGGATGEQVYDAFKEAASQNKPHMSYVRAILLDWLGVQRTRAP